MPKTLGKQLDQFGAGKAGAVPGPSAEDGSEILLSDGWQLVSALSVAPTTVHLRSQAGETPQTIQPSTWTQIKTFGLIVDPEGLYDPVTGDIESPINGLGRVCAVGTVQNLSDPNKLQVWLYINGSAYRLLGRGNSPDGTGEIIGFGGATEIPDLQVGDKIQLYCWHNESSPINLRTATFDGYQGFDVTFDPGWAALQGIVSNSQAMLSVEPHGLTLSNNSGNAQSLDIAAGSWLIWDGTQIQRVELATDWTKRLDTVFSEGNNGGLLPAATSIAADTFYYLFCGRKKTTGAIDFHVDTDVNGANLDAGFDWRYIGPLPTNSAAEIVPFKQNGSYFSWLDRPVDFNAAPSNDPNGALVSLFHCPEHDCLVDLVVSGGRHVLNAQRRSAVYGGHPDCDLSSFTSADATNAPGAWAASSYINGSDHDTLNSAPRVATSGGQIRLKAGTSGASYATFPQVIVSGVDDSQRRRNG